MNKAILIERDLIPNLLVTAKYGDPPKSPLKSYGVHTSQCDNVKHL